MSINRKDFLKKICATSICACGFSRIVSAGDNTNQASESNQANDKNNLIKEWLAITLNNLQENVSEKVMKQSLKKSAIVHYNDLQMDKVLAPYIGDLDGFITFISEKWGWKVTFDKTSGTIIADENKNFCVCPLVNIKNTTSKAICYCSEGFAEKMFSTVSGKKARAKVISSIIRGDDSCKYQIMI